MEVTPSQRQDSLSAKLGIPSLYLKREDLHPYGSHKGRSIPHMIDTYIGKGETKFVISSSGNAALAAGLHIKNLNESRDSEKLELDIFIGNHIRKDKEEKLRELEDENIRVLVKERPLQALTLRSQEGIRSLRQSTDDLALDGYVELAKELEQIPDLANIFVATSSGTTAQALAQYFSSKKISINIVQTSSCHPISDALQSYDGSDEDSIASAIVDHSAHRKTTLAPLIKKSGGTGFVASNDEILTAINMANKFANIDISPNGALSLAGLMKAIYSGVDINGSTVCIISGQ